MLEAEDKSIPWQRILWLKQSQYPDNYLDDTFLDNLQRNGELIFHIITTIGYCLTVPFAVNVRQYTYKGLVFDTMPVTQHLCSIMIFVAVFTHLYERELRYQSDLRIGEG